MKAIDRTLKIIDETFENIFTIVELPGHCTAREPYQWPNICNVVNVLAPLVEKWKPKDIHNDDSGGIDFEMRLPQDLNKWKEFKDKSVLDDS